ncbi:MAG TPA: hypothetical protein VE988_02780 [Gemmataceae bacterium]|nr:hypothetical protein [Gemmataceae bacterium]
MCREHVSFLLGAVFGLGLCLIPCGIMVSKINHQIRLIEQYHLPPPIWEEPVVDVEINVDNINKLPGRIKW